MDILEQILEYRRERNWSEYQLSLKSGIPQATISSWYRKKMTPTIPSLEKICNAFGINLCQFFADRDDLMTLTARQKKMLYHWNTLTEAQQEALLMFLESL